MKVIKQLVIAIGLMLPMICAHADVDKRARDLSASCAACHGTNGNSAGGFPMLASLDKAYFVAQMKDFKSGARPATVMHQLSKGFTDEEFELMGSFFAAQQR